MLNSRSKHQGFRLFLETSVDVMLLLIYFLYQVHHVQLCLVKLVTVLVSSLDKLRNSCVKFSSEVLQLCLAGHQNILCQSFVFLVVGGELRLH